MDVQGSQASTVEEVVGTASLVVDEDVHGSQVTVEVVVLEVVEVVVHGSQLSWATAPAAAMANAVAVVYFIFSFELQMLEGFN